MPVNAIPDSTIITFVYEKDGKKIEFTADKFPADFKVPPYKFITRYDKVVRKGKNNEPPIKGFVLRTSAGEDSTDIILSEPYCFLLFCENFSTPVTYWQKDFEKIKVAADRKGIPVYIVTASTNETKIALSKTPFAGFQVLECDFTAIRTAARTNPSLYLLKEGTVVNKWTYKRMAEAVKYLP